MSIGYDDDRRQRLLRERVQSRWHDVYAPVRHLDPVLVLTALSLTGIGLVAIYSAKLVALTSQGLPTSLYLTRQVIAAAKYSGATILQPANVYVFGTDAPPVLGADTLHRASNPLGRLRIAMEASLRDSGAPVILLRAGDFLDDAPSGGWFDKVIAAPIAKGHIRYPGAPDVPHAWGYLPDLGRAAAQLAGRRATLERFEEVPFAGYTLTGRELAAALSRVTGREIALRSMAWWPLHLARPFWGMAAGLLEMRYLWAMEPRLDAARLRALLPDFADTPPETALASALQRDVDPDEAVA